MGDVRGRGGRPQKKWSGREIAEDTEVLLIGRAALGNRRIRAGDTGKLAALRRCYETDTPFCMDGEFWFVDVLDAEGGE